MTKKEKAHMAAVSELGCIICTLYHGVKSPAEVHHTDGKTKPGAHFKTIPLCFRHHREGVDNDEYTSRHPFKKKFEARYKPESKLLSIVLAKINEST